jgi:hypothetical protein
LKYYVLLYENGKIEPVETILRIRKGRKKENEGGDEFNYDLQAYKHRHFLQWNIVQHGQFHN